ncbi:MAG: hypothetical protein ACHQQS_15240 [Thermoanaerobaculales bacterium]
MKKTLALGSGIVLSVSATFAQSAVTPQSPRRIAGISVCAEGAAGPGGSCPAGTFDTQQIVLGPDGTSINQYGAGGTSDEHASVFPPGSLQGNSGYLFFVASGTSLAIDIGVVVLSCPGPDAHGRWTMDFAQGYGSYSQGYGAVFRAPIIQGDCPTVADPTQQDQTFDLDYAAPGSIVPDPTDLPGHLLMIYEGTDTCVGNGGGRKAGTGAYITTGVATSIDDGRTWPAYRGTPTFDFVTLPKANKTQGPNAPFGALGAAVCMGTDCAQTPPPAYGRYAVLSPPTSLASVVASGQPLSESIADSEPSAFVDDAGSGPQRYVYEVHTYGPGERVAAPGPPPGRTESRPDRGARRTQRRDRSAPVPQVGRPLVLTGGHRRSRGGDPARRRVRELRSVDPGTVAGLDQLRRRRAAVPAHLRVRLGGRPGRGCPRRCNGLRLVLRHER